MMRKALCVLLGIAFLLAIDTSGMAFRRARSRRQQQHNQSTTTKETQKTNTNAKAKVKANTLVQIPPGAKYYTNGATLSAHTTGWTEVLDANGRLISLAFTLVKPPPTITTNLYKEEYQGRKRGIGSRIGLAVYSGQAPSTNIQTNYGPDIPAPLNSDGTAAGEIYYVTTKGYRIDLDPRSGYILGASTIRGGIVQYVPFYYADNDVKNGRMPAGTRYFFMLSNQVYRGFDYFEMEGTEGIIGGSAQANQTAIQEELSPFQNKNQVQLDIAASFPMIGFQLDREDDVEGPWYWSYATISPRLEDLLLTPESERRGSSWSSATRSSLQDESITVGTVQDGGAKPNLDPQDAHVLRLKMLSRRQVGLQGQLGEPFATPFSYRSPQ